LSAATVTRVHIDGDRITVDGMVLPADHSGRTPFDVALASVAASATRRRGVRVEITESFGVTRCRVLPDGTTRDLTFTYTGGEDHEPVLTADSAGEIAAASLAPPRAMAPAIAPAAARALRPAAPAVVAARRIAQSQVRRRPAWLRPVVTGTLGAVGIAALAWLLVWGALQLSTEPDPELELAPAGSATQTQTPAGPVSHGATFAPLPRLDITVTGGTGTVTVAGEQVVVRVHLRGPDRVDEKLTLSRQGTTYEVEPGRYTWVATARGRVKAAGTVVVDAPAPTEVATTPSTRESQPSPAPETTFAPPIDPDR